MPVTKRLEGETLIVTARPSGEKPVYLWQAKPVPRESLGLHLDSSLRYDLDHDLRKVQLAIEFFDASGAAMGRQMLQGPQTHAFPIPDGCTALRFGLRIYGAGEVRFRGLHFGPDLRVPPVLVARSTILLVTHQSPEGTPLGDWLEGLGPQGPDVLVLQDPSPDSFVRLGRIEVALGDLTLLEATLLSGQHDRVVLHGLDAGLDARIKAEVPGIACETWHAGLRL